MMAHIDGDSVILRYLSVSEFTKSPECCRGSDICCSYRVMKQPAEDNEVSFCLLQVCIQSRLGGGFEATCHRILSCSENQFRTDQNTAADKLFATR